MTRAKINQPRWCGFRHPITGDRYVVQFNPAHPVLAYGIVEAWFRTSLIPACAFGWLIGTIAHMATNKEGTR